MKATVFSHDQIIGTTELKPGDTSMGHVYGTFIPNQLYFDKIQAYVWDFWKTRTPDYDKWQSLNINIKLENGYTLIMQGGVTISDIEDFQSDSLQIDISGLLDNAIEKYFPPTSEQKYHGPFLS